MWMSGLSASRIGQAMGMTANAVVGRVHRLGLPQRGVPAGLDGQRPVQDALTPAQRADIARMWESGLSSGEIARRMGEGWTRHRVQHLAESWGLKRAAAASGPRRVAAMASALVTRARAAPQPPAPPPPIPRDLARGGCLWPLWGQNERPTHLYCGEPISAGCARPWCDRHRAIGTSVREVA